MRYGVECSVAVETRSKSSRSMIQEENCGKKTGRKDYIYRMFGKLKLVYGSGSLQNIFFKLYV